MPLKLSIGLSKKIGLPDYGSLGASCQVEVELDASLFNADLERFHQHVRRAYAACAQAVNDELARHQTGGSGSSASAGAAPPASAAASPPPQRNEPPANGGDGRRASDKQLDYLQLLAGQIKGLGPRRLEALARKMFSKPPAELSSLEASGLIDTLKEIKAGNISLDAALNGAPA